MWGNRLKLWNTMPIFPRCSRGSRSPGPSGTPWTRTVPRSWVSNRLMQRISVDLPDPDGPQMTTHSPSPMLRSTSRSTWNVPNHLLTSSNAIMDGVSPDTDQVPSIIAFILAATQSTATSIMPCPFTASASLASWWNSRSWVARSAWEMVSLAES